MSRAIAKPIIQLGLLNVPTRIETLQRNHDIGFSYVCPSCKESGVKQKWYCPKCNKDHLNTTEFLKGYSDKISGTLKVFTKEQIANFESSGKVEIIGVIPSGEIPFYMVEKTYSLMPNADIDKDHSIFGLFYNGLVDFGYIAIGKYVMRNKEHIVAVIPHSQRLFMAILYYPDEIELTETLKATKSSQDHAELLKTLFSKIEKPSIEKFELKDDRTEAIIEMIENGTEIQIEARPSKKENIAEALRKSIEVVA
jgi:DNA end-binding protein Ku